MIVSLCHGSAVVDSRRVSFWLIEFPAAIVTLWFTIYRIVLTVATVACVSLVMGMLALAALGVRWGW